MLRFRPLEPRDVDFVAEVMTAVRPPGSAIDPVVLRYEWENEQSGTQAVRHIAERDGARVGFAVLERAVEGPARAHATLFGDLVRAARDPQELDELVACEQLLGGFEDPSPGLGCLSLAVGGVVRPGLDFPRHLCRVAHYQSESYSIE